MVLAHRSGSMNPFSLYLILLKATVTTFSGLASIPVLRADLVLHRHVLTDQQLNIAIVVTRTTPGPAGLYIVSVGYFVDGIAGAIAGWAAMATPALLILPLIRYAGDRAEHPRIQNAIQAVVIASAGLLWATAFPIAREAITDSLTCGIVIVGTGILLTRKVESLWVIVGAAILYISAASLHLVVGL
jgi:chromate transporter